MIAEIITIGDEILVGQTVDTNSAWMSKQLKMIGIPVRQITSIADTREAIIGALDNALNSADLVLITGGLGPTKDDITKHVLTEYFEDELIFYPEIAQGIEAYFTSAGRDFLEVNRQQAMLPKAATILENDLGTASGMWFQKNGKDILSMPGVPYEMRGLMTKFLDAYSSNHALGDFYHSTILFQGIPESVLAHEIEDLETQIREEGINMSYLPTTGSIKVRLTSTSEKKEKIKGYIDELARRYPAQNYGLEDDKLEAVLGKLFTDLKATVGTVESCSGGALAQRLVSVPGSSTYYKGSIVSYAYELKESLVGVSNEDLWKHGAVSQQVVEQMARGGRKALNVDYCIATSGIAGPDGGTEDKPVGTVWMAIASPDKIYSKRFNFRQNRERNIESTVVYGLNYLRRVIIGIEDK